MKKAKEEKKETEEQKNTSKENKDFSNQSSNTKKKKLSNKTIAYISIGVIVVLIVLAGIYFLQGPSESTEEENIVASVNGEEIEQSKVDEIQQSMASQGQQISEKQAAEQLIQLELLKQKAEEKGYSVTTQEAEENLKERGAQQNQSLEQIKQQVKMQGMDYDDLIKQYKEQIMIQEYIENEVETSEITDEEAENFYQATKQRMGEEAPSFEELGNSEKEQIKMQVQQLEQQQAIQSLLQKLKEEAEIEYHKNLENETNQPQQIQQPSGEGSQQIQIQQ